MAQNPSELPDVPNPILKSAQFGSDEFSIAFSQEIKKLSEQPPVTEYKVRMTLPGDQLGAPNPAVDNLPALSIERSTGKPVEPKLNSWTDTALDVGLGAAAVVAVDAGLSVLTKNPKFMAMAVETLQSGGKLALMTNPRIVAPILGVSGTTFGAAIATRHYAVEGLSGQSESWLDSANHVGLGVGVFAGARYLGNKFAPEKPLLPKV